MNHIAAHAETIDAAEIAAAAIADKKGTDVVALDLSELLVITDVFLLGSAGSARQVRALMDGAEEALREKLDRRPLRREGTEDVRWVVLDYGDLVIHLFDRETRDYYDLERLWADAPRIQVEVAPERQ